jgi:hypothetical protein
LFDPVNGYWPAYTGNGQIADQTLTASGIPTGLLLLLSESDNEPDQNLASIIFYQTDPEFTETMFGCTEGQFCTRDHQSRSGEWAITFTGDPGLTFSEVGALSPVPCPSSFWLFATGLSGLGLMRRRKAA